MQELKKFTAVPTKFVCLKSDHIFYYYAVHTFSFMRKRSLWLLEPESKTTGYQNKSTMTTGSLTVK